MERQGATDGAKMVLTFPDGKVVKYDFGAYSTDQIIIHVDKGSSGTCNTLLSACADFVKHTTLKIMQQRPELGREVCMEFIRTDLQRAVREAKARGEENPVTKALRELQGTAGAKMLTMGENGVDRLMRLEQAFDREDIDPEKGRVN